MIWDNDPTSPSFGLITDPQSPHFGLPVDEVMPPMVEGPSGAPIYPDQMNARMLSPNEIPSRDATAPPYTDILKEAIDANTRFDNPAKMDVPYPIGGAIEEPPIGKRAYDELRRLVHQGITGEPALPRPTNTAERVENAIMEFPGDVAGYLTTPEGAMVAGAGFLGPVVRGAMALGFTGDQIKQFIEAGTLEDKVKTAFGALLAASGVRHEFKGARLSAIDHFFRDEKPGLSEGKLKAVDVSKDVLRENLNPQAPVQEQQQQQTTSDISPTLNIGANIGDQRNALKVEKVLGVLKNLGVNLARKPYLKAGGEEPTFIINPDKALTREQGLELAKQLQQQAIPQYAGGKGDMFVPEPEKLANPEWAKFNSDYFQALDERGQPTMLNDLMRPRGKPIKEVPAPAAGLSEEQHNALATLQSQAADLRNEVGDFLGKAASPEKFKLQDQLWKTYDQIHALRQKSGQPRDFVIIGGGPAGLKAAAHAAYEGLDTVLLEKDASTGGAAKRSQEIVNTAATDIGATGRDYFRPKYLTARNRGAQVRTGVEVKTLRARPDGGVDVITSTGEVIPARRALVATGTTFNQHPGYELAGYGNAERLVAATRKGKVGLVYGAGNSATQAVVGAIRNGAKKIIVMSRHPFGPGASADQVERLRALEKEGKVQFITDSITGITGNKNDGYTVTTQGGEKLKVAHVETFLDSKFNSGFLPKDVETIPGKHGAPGTVRVLDASLKTTMPGVYVGGDIRESLPGEDRPRRIDMAEGDAAGIAARVVNDIYKFRKDGSLPEWKPSQAETIAIDQELKRLKGEPIPPEPTETTTGTTTTGTAQASTPKQSPISREVSPTTTDRNVSGVQSTPSRTSSATSSEPIGVNSKAIKEQAEAGRYGKAEVNTEPGKGTSVADLRKEGQKAALNGEDYNEAVGRLQQAGHDVARLRTEYERLAHETNKAQAAWYENKTPETRKAYEAAQQAEADFYNRTVKAAKAPVSDALRAFQGKVEPEADTFEGLTRIARATTGKPLTPRQEARIRRSYLRVKAETNAEAKSLKSLSMALRKTPIRSNRRLRDTGEMRDLLQELKDKLTPCQK